MANKNFGKNLLLALGSLGAFLGAVNPNISAMESVQNNVDKKHEQLNEILDKAEQLSSGKEQYFDGGYHRDWTKDHIYETCNKINELRINKNGLSTNEKLKLKLFVLKLTEWMLIESNYGVKLTHPGLTKSGGSYVDDRLNFQALKKIWTLYFENDKDFVQLSRIIKQADDDLDRFIKDKLACQTEDARDIHTDIETLDEIINQTV